MSDREVFTLAWRVGRGARAHVSTCPLVAANRAARALHTVTQNEILRNGILLAREDLDYYCSIDKLLATWGYVDDSIGIL